MRFFLISRAFNIFFTDKNGKKEYTYQTEFGFSQRSILISIWLSSKNDNLFLLPTLSPIQVVIIQIDSDDYDVYNYSQKVLSSLKSHNIKVFLDSEKGQLYKRFSKYETMGVPIRIEIGKNEFKSNSIRIVRQDNRQKIDCSFKNAVKIIKNTCKNIIFDVYTKNKQYLKKNIVVAKKQSGLIKIIKSDKIAKIQLCQTENCTKEFQTKIGFGEIIGFDLYKNNIYKKCINCSKKTTHIAYYARRV